MSAPPPNPSPRWLHGPLVRLRRWLFLGLAIGALVAAARIHACACTGGRPEWRPVDTSTQPHRD